MPERPAVHSERDGSVATVTLAHGERNLLDPEVMGELCDAIAAVDADPEALAIVLTATGETFCGGLDLEALQNGGDPIEFATALVRVLKLMPALDTALVGAVNGDALASGFSIVCACDLVIAVPEARLGTFEASIGIWPMIAQVPPLQRLLPRHALQNIITGVPFSAEEALRFGAINRIVPAERLRDVAYELAASASSAGPALKAGRKSFYRFVDLPYEQALDQAFDAFTRMFHASRRAADDG